MYESKNQYAKRILYRCTDCGSVFDDPVYSSWMEDDGFMRHGLVCPVCKSDDYEEGCACQLCGGFSEDEYCDDCVSQLRKDLENLISENFNSDEIEAIKYLELISEE